MSDKVVHSNVLALKLSASQSPKITIDYGKNIYRWGRNNKYPEEKLLYWYNNSAVHGAICRGKARYLAGTKIESDNQDADVINFLDYANPLEDWHSLSKKIKLDKVVCGGFFIKIVTNILGTPLQFYHLDFAKCRFSECGKFVDYSEDWTNIYKYPVTSYPLYTKGAVGTTVMYYKDYNPSSTKIDSVYPKPEYENAMQDIDTDARVSVFFNSLVQNNFSVGTIVTVRNGEKDAKIQKNIAERLKGEHGGEENAGKPVIIFTSKDGGTTEVVTLNGNDLDKQYVEITKRNHQNIIAGHGVNGVLFKIKTEGQLGGRSEIIEAHELFLNEYVKIEQVAFNKMLAEFCYLRTGKWVNFDIEQVTTIGLDLPLENQNVINALNAKSPQILIEYVIEKFGIKVPELPAGQAAAQVEANSNLKDLSGRQYQGMLRIVRDYDKGKTTRQQAILLLQSGYGMSETEAAVFLNENDDDDTNDVMAVKQAADKQAKFKELFLKLSHEINFDDEVIDVQFATVVDASVTDIRNSILNEFKGNPNVKVSVLAEKYGKTKDEINDIINFLVNKKLITSSTEGYVPTSKGTNKDTTEVETEIYTEYVYGLRADQSGKPLVISTTREFCRDMVALTATRAITFEAISSLTNELGESAWDFRGGFYNNGTETTTFCRHVWKAVTKIRRK
jgi:hypothetical protein